MRLGGCFREARDWETKAGTGDKNREAFKVPMTFSATFGGLLLAFAGPLERRKHELANDFLFVICFFFVFVPLSCKVFCLFACVLWFCYCSLVVCL